MKIILKKCVFVFASGRFLCLMVSTRGIDANPNKVQAILSLLEQTTKRDV